LPTIVDPQLMVAVPEPKMLRGLIAVQVKPEGIASDRATVPAKPLSPVTVRVAGRLDPTFTWIGDGDVRLKSTTLIVMASWRERGELVPVMVTL
jgi:hypothetical protein